MIRKPKIAIGGVIIINNKILLAKRRDEPDKNKWAIPGGKLELNETLEEGLKREMKEETSLDIKKGKLLGIIEVVNDNFHYVILDYECNIISGDIRSGSDALDIKYFDLNNLTGNINETTMEFISKIKSGVFPVSIISRKI
jgi:8-oxo-dGTP diphosphatase